MSNRLVLPMHNGRIYPPWEDRKHLPPWLDTEHPEALRGTTRLRPFDPGLTVGWNRIENRFEIWGHSLRKGRVCVCACIDDDGAVFVRDVPWDRLIASLWDMREGPAACERAEAANAKLRAAQDAERDAEMTERLGLTAEGLLRNRCEDPQDVLDAVNRQVGGVKPAPRGQKIYLPGDQSDG